MFQMELKLVMQSELKKVFQTASRRSEQLEKLMVHHFEQKMGLGLDTVLEVPQFHHKSHPHQFEVKN